MVVLYSIVKGKSPWDEEANRFCVSRRMKSFSPSTATGNGGRAVVVVCGVDSSEAKDGTAPMVPTSLNTSVGDLEPSPSGVENAAGGEGVCEY